MEAGIKTANVGGKCARVEKELEMNFFLASCAYPPRKEKKTFRQIFSSSP